MLILRRFWFEFDRWSSTRARLTPFCGVTAFDADDAKRLMQKQLFRGGLPKVAEVTENVDVAGLPDEVRMHMWPPNWRGLWYPLGYQDTAGQLNK